MYKKRKKIPRLTKRKRNVQSSIDLEVKDDDNVEVRPTKKRKLEDKDDLHSICVDGTEHIILSNWVNKTEGKRTYSGYWSDHTYRSVLVGSFSTGILVYSKGPFYPTAQDNEVLQDTYIPGILDLCDEYGIGDEKYSPFLRIKTKKMYVRRPGLLAIVQNERPTVEFGWKVQELPTSCWTI